MMEVLVSLVAACSLAVLVWAKEPMAIEAPGVSQPKMSEEWLAMKDSKKAHRFLVHPALNPHYRHSLCGFVTTDDQVEPESVESVRCQRCLSKG